LSEPLRFLFDECISATVMDSLAEIFAVSYDGVQFKHIRDYQLLGVEDKVWLPQIQSEGGWIVITADRGKAGGKDADKLPMICDRLGITHVVLSAPVHQQKMADKVASVIAVFKELVDLIQEAVPGARFSIRKTALGRVHVVRVEKRQQKRDAGDESGAAPET
jgi:hypothetical protein